MKLYYQLYELYVEYTTRTNEEKKKIEIKPKKNILPIKKKKQKATRRKNAIRKEKDQRKKWDIEKKNKRKYKEKKESIKNKLFFFFNLSIKLIFPEIQSKKFENVSGRKVCLEEFLILIE